MLSSILVNESINNQTLAGVLCVPSGHIFVCAHKNKPQTLDCLDSWRLPGQCLLGNLTTTLTILELITKVPRNQEDKRESLI